MYRSAMSTRLSRGRSTPAIRATSTLLALALPLLVPRVVRADHEHAAAAPDDLAPVAHPLHRRPYLHLLSPSRSSTGPTGYLYRYTMRPRVRSYGESSTSTRSPGRIRM